MFAQWTGNSKEHFVAADDSRAETRNRCPQLRQAEAHALVQPKGASLQIIGKLDNTQIPPVELPAPTAT
jgi:hypothetical protein